MVHQDLHLAIVTQERQLLSAEITQVTVMTAEGEVTILPGHIGLFTRLKEGMLTYKTNSGGESSVAIFGGFMDVSPSGNVTILADAADRAEDLDEQEIEQARVKAEAVLKDEKLSQNDFALAELTLSRAYLKLKVARKGRVAVPKGT